MFCDSTTVLNWLANPDKKFKSFESFRLKRIRLLTDLTEWRHCPSGDNPSDICSHGLHANASNAKKWRFFIAGPEWLRGDESSWPEAKPVKKEPLVPTIKIAAIDSNWKESNWIMEIAGKRSDWDQKVNAVAKARRMFKNFIQFLKDKRTKRTPTKPKQTKYLLNDEYNHAELMLVKAIQIERFGEEREILIELKVRSADARTELKTKGSKLVNLNPYVDSHGIMRSGGRLVKADSLTLEQKFPAIMPRKDESTDALIRHEHEKLCHAGANHVFHSLRKKFHVLGGRTTINRVISKCLFCQKQFKRPTQQKNGVASDREGDIRKTVRSKCYRYMRSVSRETWRSRHYQKVVPSYLMYGYTSCLPSCIERYDYEHANQRTSQV